MIAGECDRGDAYQWLRRAGRTWIRSWLLAARVVSLGARYHASPSDGVFDAALGGLFRVSALPAERVPPFGEIGPAVHFVTESAGGATSSGFAFGLDAALGLTIDFTRHFALDLAGRGEILLRGDGPLQVVLTPMAGVAIHP